MYNNSLKSVHIVGIGGCAASGIAELLVSNGVKVTGSEQKSVSGLDYLERIGVKITYEHSKNNLLQNGQKPDLLLYSPAVISLNPNNPEIIGAKELGIKSESWQNFIGDYLNTIGKTGITVSGSEGKGTTAGVLTMILKGTEYDPLSILGAKIKDIIPNGSSNIYFGNGSTYILEGDEYNRNFHNYHPAYNVMINFSYEHPETYRNFDEYKDGFYNFFKGMTQPATLILRAIPNCIDLVNRYKLDKSHKIIWICEDSSDLYRLTGERWLISDQITTVNGSSFSLNFNGEKYDFTIGVLPSFMIINSAAAVVTAFKLGLDYKTIFHNLKKFKGMVRRYDLYETKGNGRIITDYGHSPDALNCIYEETKAVFGDMPIHYIFHPHLYSRTKNFFEEFISVLSKPDRVSVLDVYPAREDAAVWEPIVNSRMLVDRLNAVRDNVFYAGKPENIAEVMKEMINPDEITVFIGAGNMDHYYEPLIKEFGGC